MIFLRKDRKEKRRWKGTGWYHSYERVEEMVEPAIASETGRAARPVPDIRAPFLRSRVRVRAVYAMGGGISLRGPNSTKHIKKEALVGSLYKEEGNKEKPINRKAPRRYIQG